MEVVFNDADINKSNKPTRLKRIKATCSCVSGTIPSEWSCHEGPFGIDPPVKPERFHASFMPKIVIGSFIQRYSKLSGLQRSFQATDLVKERQANKSNLSATSKQPLFNNLSSFKAKHQNKAVALNGTLLSHCELDCLQLFRGFLKLLSRPWTWTSVLTSELQFKNTFEFRPISSTKLPKVDQKGNLVGLEDKKKELST